MKRNSKKNRRQQPQPSAQGMSFGSSLLDIIIPVRGRFDLLEKCLESIEPAFPEIAYNIIIIDNASHEEAVPEHALVNDFYNAMTFKYPGLIVLRQKENLGFPRACNVAVRRKTSPLIFFLNSDIILDPNSGLKLINKLDNPMVGIVGMKLRFASESDYVDARMNASIRPPGRLQHICLSVNYNGDIHHPFIGWDVDHPRVNVLTSVCAVTGAALMTRRNLFMKAGGFYEGYGMGTFEDVDLCMTVREQGHDIVAVPEATGIHYTNATMEQLKSGFPLQTNASVFKGRWGDKLLWWDYFVL